MNPGAVEEVGQTTRSFMDAMKEQPLALALCVMNMALLALFFYAGHWTSQTRQQEFKMIFDQNDKVHQLLFQCVPPEMRERFTLSPEERKKLGLE